MCPVDHISNGYIARIDRSRHGGVLTRETLERDTEGFRRPVLYKSMAPVVGQISNRSFFEKLGADDDEVSWIQQEAGKGPWLVSPDNARTGAASELLRLLFDSPTNVYAIVGPMAPYGSEGGAWAQHALWKLRAALIDSSWFQVDEWRLSGHAFLGYTDTDFGDTNAGYPGTGWHSICTLNMFVMAAGVKRWMTCPPDSRLEPPDLSGPKAGGREWGSLAGPENFDTVYVEPGDVLVNPPYEWHKILNAKGFSCGAAFRVRDVEYVRDLVEARVPTVAQEMGVDAPAAQKAGSELSELATNERTTGAADELCHLLTSARYASRDANRARLIVSLLEHRLLADWLEDRQEQAGDARVGESRRDPGSTQETAPDAGAEEAALRFVALYAAGSGLPMDLGQGWRVTRAARRKRSSALDLAVHHDDGRMFSAFVERRGPGQNSFAATRYLAVSYYPEHTGVADSEVAEQMRVLVERLRAAEESLAGADVARLFEDGNA